MKEEQFNILIESGEVVKIYDGMKKEYYISKSGKLYSFDKKSKTIITIKLQRSKKGYLQYMVRSKNQRVKINIHRTVAITFIPNPENKAQVNHIDGNKENNDISNLEWMTNKENCTHAHETGLHAKSNDNKQLFTFEIAEEIRRKYKKTSITQRQLAKEYNTTHTTIGMILRNERYKAS